MEVSDSQLPKPESRLGTLDADPALANLRLQGYHLLRQAFPGHFSLVGREEVGSITLHLPQVSL